LTAAAEGGGAETVRLFFALWPEVGVRHELTAWQKKLQQGVNARAVRPWTLHLTLAFLGATPVAQLDAAKDAAAGARGKLFDLLLDVAGFWPHNQIAWVGTSTAPPALQALQSTLTSRLTAAGVGFDVKPFHAHLTLLRNVRNPKPEWPQEIVAWPVRDFVLVESMPGKDGSRYEIVARFPLQ
jgi:2'-5' RNA ligase